jgi:hypothetical protein
MMNRGNVPPIVEPVEPQKPEPETEPVVEYEYSWRFYKNWWNKIKALLGIIPPMKRLKKK